MDQLFAPPNYSLDTVSMSSIILYGSEIPSWDIRRNIFTMQSLVDHLKRLGLKIVKNRIDKYEIVVEAMRP